MYCSSCRYSTTWWCLVLNESVSVFSCEVIRMRKVLELTLSSCGRGRSRPTRSRSSYCPPRTPTGSQPPAPSGTSWGTGRGQACWSAPPTHRWSSSVLEELIASLRLSLTHTHTHTHCRLHPQDSAHFSTAAFITTILTAFSVIF